MRKASVVLVAYRSAAYLARGLPPLLDDPAVGEVVVVDNSADPATADLVRGTSGRVRLVDPGINLGFARACNLGASLTDDPVVAFLNPDVLLTRGLGELVAACLADVRLVLAGGLVAHPDAVEVTNARHRVTPRGELRRAVLGSASSTFPLPVVTGRVPVPQVDGALLVTGRTFFDELGGFDERFELYYEDVDLCERARAQGSVQVDTRAWGVHESGASSRTAVGPSYTVFRVSRTRYLQKRHGRAGARLALACGLLELLARTTTRQPEGTAVRACALRSTFRECRRPGSVQVLVPRGEGPR